MLKIIIPTYKARYTLPRALDSLVTQTKPMFLVTLVQDCDGEDYSDIIEEYKKRGLHINLISLDENMGPGNARQIGMNNDEMCDYFMFLDADDMLTPMAVDVLYREAKKNKSDIVVSDIYRESTNEPGFIMDWERTPCTWCHGKVYRAAYLREKGITFHKFIRLNEDSYFNLVATNSTKNRVGVHIVTYIWRDNPNSLTRCGTEEDFFRKSWIQYISSQVYGIQEILRINDSINMTLLAKTIHAIYDHAMTAMCLGEDINLPIITELRDNEVVQSALDNIEFWDTIDNTLRASKMLDSNLYFFKMRFVDWINQYVKKKGEETK